LKARAVNESGKERLKLDTLERKIAPEELSKRQLQSKCDELQLRQSQLQKELEVTGGREEQARMALDRVKGELAAMLGDARQRQQNRLRLQHSEAEVSEGLQACLGKLLEAKAGAEESEREVRLRSAIDTLKRIFPGVHGRLVDLCQPSHRRYDQAMSVVLGRHGDAVVIEHQRVAVEALRYLREERLPMLTILPLDALMMPSAATLDSLRQRLTQHHQTSPPARLAVDVCRAKDAAVDRAIAFACGTTLVTESVDVARQLVYDLRIRAKCVALDGSIVHRNGHLTGGSVSERAAQQWEEREVRELKAERDRLLGDLQGIHKDLKRLDLEDRLSAQQLDLGDRVKYLTDELVRTCEFC
jgi:structural maintenance of chromosome 1